MNADPPHLPHIPPLEETRPWEHPGVAREFINDIPDYLGKGPNAPIWTLYATKAKDFDGEMLETWDKTMDVLLIFSALFSAVVTAFLVLSLALLQPDNAGATFDALAGISAQLSALTSNDADRTSIIAAYQPNVSSNLSVAYIWINVLWFTSLAISLFTSVLVMLIKQWLRAY
ncbi:hypothetical protein CALCODRAFT_426263, partial [Calocera cornea HHB12733]